MSPVRRSISLVIARSSDVVSALDDSSSSSSSSTLSPMLESGLRTSCVTCAAIRPMAARRSVWMRRCLVRSSSVTSSTTTSTDRRGPVGASIPNGVTSTSANRGRVVEHERDPRQRRTVSAPSHLVDRVLEAFDRPPEARVGEGLTHRVLGQPQHGLRGAVHCPHDAAFVDHHHRGAQPADDLLLHLLELAQALGRVAELPVAGPPPRPPCARTRS